MACNGPTHVSRRPLPPTRGTGNANISPPGGGLSLSKNRTYWPTTGGTIAFQPGWFSGHATAFLYINIGLDADGPDGGPMDFDHPLVSPWQLLGPSNGPYPGTLCLPDVKVPADLGVKAGDKATIQIVELATHGASLFAVSHLPFSLLPPHLPSPRESITSMPKDKGDKANEVASALTLSSSSPATTASRPSTTRSASTRPSSASPTYTTASTRRG